MKKGFKRITVAMMIAIATSSFSLSAYADNDVSVVSVDGSSIIDNAPIIGEMQPNSYYGDLNKLKESEISSAITRASNESKRLNILQVPQETNYWCGYAAMKSLLDYEGVVMSQSEIASKTWNPDDACPWYTMYGTQRDQFPVPNVLEELTGFYYCPYPFGGAGSTELTESDIKPKIVSTIDKNHGVLACGESYRTYDREGSRLPGYPAQRISHWIAIDGYESYGSEVWVVDPAKSDKISWSSGISANYKISTEKLASFATMKGIVW